MNKLSTSITLSFLLPLPLSLSICLSVWFFFLSYTPFSFVQFLSLFILLFPPPPSLSLSLSLYLSIYLSIHLSLSLLFVHLSPPISSLSVFPLVSLSTLSLLLPLFSFGSTKKSLPSPWHDGSLFDSEAQTSHCVERLNLPPSPPLSLPPSLSLSVSLCLSLFLSLYLSISVSPPLSNFLPRSHAV